MVVAERLRVLDPTSEAVIEAGSRAARVDTLDGKVLGLFNNQKLNAPQLLEMVGEVLSERYNLKGIVRGTYSSSQHHSWSEWQEKGASGCDVAILTHGD
jgi:hypothetical protein